MRRARSASYAYGAYTDPWLSFLREHRLGLTGEPEMLAKGGGAGQGSMRRDPKLTRCHLILGVLLSISPTPARCCCFDLSCVLLAWSSFASPLRPLPPAAGPQEL